MNENNKVLITGTSQSIAKQSLNISLRWDIRDYDNLPEIDEVEILINNVGTQNENDININLKALIKVTEK
jgi:short-subunit dehydrogenase